MRGLGLGIAVAAAAFLPAQALGCRVSTNHSAFVHNSLPPVLDRKWIVADVEFEAADTEAVYETGVRARVRRMIQGRYEGKTLLVRPTWKSSCSHPFENGLSGLIVGVAAGIEDGVLVLDPIEVSRQSGFRLPLGFRLPDDYFARPILR